MPTATTAQALVDIGLTPLEAEVYLFLLQESPATGYRVAQAIGKSVGNTYKALESLEDKGAILVDHGENRLCRAIKASELLKRLDRTWKSRREAAEQLLAELETTPADDGLYRLRSRDQIFERCRAMIEQSTRIVLVVASHDPLMELRRDLEAAAARGVAVGLKTYEPIEVQGAEVLVDPRGREAEAGGPGQWLNVSVDTSETLLVLLSPDGSEVRQGISTSNLYVSWVFFTGLFSAMVLPEVQRLLEQEAPSKAIAERLESLAPLAPKNSPGKEGLIRRYRRGRRRT